MSIGTEKESDFDQVRRTDSTVATTLRYGGTVEDCVIQLAREKASLLQKLMELEAIAPRRIKLPDGKTVVYRVPENLIPIQGGS